MRRDWFQGVKTLQNFIVADLKMPWWQTGKRKRGGMGISIIFSPGLHYTVWSKEEGIPHDYEWSSNKLIVYCQGNYDLSLLPPLSFYHPSSSQNSQVPPTRLFGKRHPFRRPASDPWEKYWYHNRQRLFFKWYLQIYSTWVFLPGDSLNTLWNPLPGINQNQT